MQGYLAYPAGGAADGNKHPAVVILPDWDGQNQVKDSAGPMDWLSMRSDSCHPWLTRSVPLQYEISRANMLAEMGYVALGAPSLVPTRPGQ